MQTDSPAGIDREGMDDGSWAHLIKPVVMHFDIAAQFGMDATWNAEGAAACSKLWKHMARLLDDEVKARTDAEAHACRAALDAMTDGGGA